MLSIVHAFNVEKTADSQWDDASVLAVSLSHDGAKYHSA